MIKVGDVAPDFELSNSAGYLYTLKYLYIYEYSAAYAIVVIIMLFYLYILVKYHSYIPFLLTKHYD
jgi:hypothetical protein